MNIELPWYHFRTWPGSFGFQGGNGLFFDASIFIRRQPFRDGRRHRIVYIAIALEVRRHGCNDLSIPTGSNREASSPIDIRSSRCTKRYHETMSSSHTMNLSSLVPSVVISPPKLISTYRKHHLFPMIMFWPEIVSMCCLLNEEQNSGCQVG